MVSKTIISSKSSIIPFLLGVIMSNNIAYVFVVGTTPIMLANFVSVIIVVYAFFFDNKNLLQCISHIPKCLIIWFICAVFSIVPIFFFHLSYSYQWFVGIIDLLLNFSVVVAVLLYRRRVNYIVNGVFIGIVLNLLRVIYEFYMYRSGKIVNFSDFFPYSSILINYIGNPFRGEGFFREPGHLMRFLAVFSIPLLVYFKNKTKKVFYALLLALLLLFSSTLSASMLIFIIGLSVYYIISRIRSHKKIFTSMFILAIVVFGIIVAYNNVSEIRVILDRVIFSAENFSANDSSNSTRITGMQKAMNFIMEYPLVGSGWNTLTILFKDNGIYGVDSIYGSYSYLLTLFVNLGLGAIPYFLFMILYSIEQLKQKNELSIAFGSAMIITMLLSITTDFTFTSNVAFFFGLAIAYSNKDKDLRKLRNFEQK